MKSFKLNQFDSFGLSDKFLPAIAKMYLELIQV